MIDTHCHLDSIKEETSEVLNKAQKAGVNTCITIAVDPSNLSKVLDLAKLYPQVYATQGIHPHDAKSYSKEVEKEIRINIKKNSAKIVAIGEIGLDYHYNFSPPDIQRQVFSSQLALAEELELPIVIHSREADEDMITILREWGPRLGSKKGVLHSFSSSEELGLVAIEEGFYIGVNGMITFKNAHDLRNIISKIPLEKIILETDSPYLAPIPHRGKENTPYYLPFVAEKLAEIHGVSLAKLIEITSFNARELFNLPESI